LQEQTKKLESGTTIRKHVEVVKRPMQLIELNKGLNLRQQRFFNLAILKVDDGVSEISKADFDEIFEDTSDKFYSLDVVSDVRALGGLGLLSGEGRSVTWDNVFIRVQYDDTRSVYRFEWSPYMKDRIENVRKNYIQQDLKTLAHFKNKYSFIWYDYFKSNFRQWKWKMTKDELINLLRLENKESYLRNQTMLSKHCIELPLKELNEFTEYKITYETIKKGRAVIGYEFKRFTEKEVVLTVSKKQLDVLKEIIDRYGDTGAIMQEIASFAVVDAEAVPYLTQLYFDIQGFKRFIAASDAYTAEAFKDIVALAIKKDNEFKAKVRGLYELKAHKPKIDDFIQEQAATKPIFYNWLEERE